MFQCPTPIVQILPPTHDSEWVKNVVLLVIGAILGIASALFVEPIKVKLLRKLDAARAKELIYDELGGVLAALKATTTFGEEQCAKAVRRMTFQRYDFYFNDRREVFYTIPLNKGLWTLRAQIELNREPDTVKRNGAKHALDEIINAFEFSMNEGEVDSELIKSAEAKHNKKADEQGGRLYDHIMKDNKA